MEPLILATAMGEAVRTESARVEDHLKGCVSCRIVLEQYRQVDAMVLRARLGTVKPPGLAAAHKMLQQRLTDLRRRVLTYGLFPSPVGPLLIARSEEGVSLVEFLRRRNVGGSLLSRLPEVEVIEKRHDVEPLYQELLDYLRGRRTNLDWPLDLRLARSDFQRKVLRVTAGLPYGAVASYVFIARRIGKPRTVQAVAQALRWNPVPIAIPSHRVVGTSGSLTDHAGGTMLQQLLLAIEGVQFVKSPRAFKIKTEVMYACAPGDHAYCVPTCRSLKRVKPGRAMLFASRSIAEAAGLSPCVTCRPDLYPLLTEAHPWQNQGEGIR
jgi:O-6-methylguanine DNA methyltransferase